MRIFFNNFYFQILAELYKNIEKLNDNIVKSFKEESFPVFLRVYDLSGQCRKILKKKKIVRKNKNLSEEKKI